MSSGPLTLSISAPIHSLISNAIRGRLTICVGAGVSIGSGLPSGSKLAQMLHKEFEGHITGYQCAEVEDLTAVAAAMSSLPEGLSTMQVGIVEIAPFTSAPPTLGHKLLALLFVEGAVRILTTNWDDCLERGWTEEERIQAASDASGAEQLHSPHILKIHGCSTRPPTLLVTEEQLNAPPLWTKSVFRTEIESSTMVFVGIGDVAPYVREPISELAAFVDGARIRVVSPSIVAKWKESEWKRVLPSLAPERRLAMSSDEFADELARGWLQTQLLRHFEGPEESEWVAQCCSAFRQLTSFDALAWLRRAATGWPIGESVVRSSEAVAAVKGISILLRQLAEKRGVGATPAVRFERRAAVSLDDQRVEVLLARPNQPTTTIERLARRRAETVANTEGVDQVTILCAASFAEGKQRSLLEAYDVLAGEQDSDDLISGPAQVPVRLEWADRLLSTA